MISVGPGSFFSVKGGLNECGCGGVRGYSVGMEGLKGCTSGEKTSRVTFVLVVVAGVFWGLVNDY